MGHKIYTVKDFEIVDDYTLQIEFDDGVQQTIDFEPCLHGAVFGPLRDLDMFNQVEIEPHFKNLVWPNDAEFDPEILHDWNKHRDEMIERAKEWAKVRV
jgi:hypothetical protein